MDYKQINDEIAGRIREFLESENFSNPTEFSRKIGIEEKTFLNHINLVTSVSLKTIVAILQTYPEVDANWLLRGVKIDKGEPNNNYMQNELVRTLMNTINVYNKQFLTNEQQHSGEALTILLPQENIAEPTIADNKD